MAEGATALDRMLLVTPRDALAFAMGSSVVRGSMHRYADSLLITPERGALPIFWCAEGDTDIEGPMPRVSHTSPLIGSFQYTRSDGAAAMGTLNPEQKRQSVNDTLDKYSGSSSFVILDEVQKGGTMAELTPIVRKRGAGLAIIAAQDSRTRVSREHKNKYYTQLASNSIGGVSVSVVPMPLIATDRSLLLNQLYLNGNETNLRDAKPDIILNENTDAQTIFRQLGTLVRHAGYSHSDEFLHQLGALPRQQSTDGALEQWAERVVAHTHSRINN